jgi:putative phosphoesterase
MRLGIISDLHSNIHALDAVMPVMEQLRIDHLIVLGDFFGYYPWARQTWERLSQAPWPLTRIKGNHDEMLLRRVRHPAQDLPSDYHSHIVQNLEDLSGTDAIETLKTLSFSRALDCEDQTLLLVHGTPRDPENGRHYPSDSVPTDWETGAASWLLLGHTHYPLLTEMRQGSWLLNPGSVGQPRDGDPRASFATIDLELNQATLHRVEYDVPSAQQALRELGWCERSIRALDKRHSGSLDQILPQS